MVIYAWKCPDCQIHEDTSSLAAWDCPSCGLPMRRDYRSIAVGTKLNFEPHWNASVGCVVHSMDDFRDKLKAAEQKTYETTGRESYFRAVDPRDFKPMTEEGIESRNKILHDNPSQVDRVAHDLNR